MFHVELSTSGPGSRAMFHVEHASAVRTAGAWPGRPSRRGKRRGTASLRAAPGRRSAGRPRPDRLQAEQRRARRPASGRRRRAGGSLTTSRPPTRAGGRRTRRWRPGDRSCGRPRRRRCPGAASGPTTSARPSTTATRRAPGAATASSRNRQRLARGVEQHDRRGRAGRRRGPARARRRRCRGRRPCPAASASASRKPAACSMWAVDRARARGSPRRRARSSCVEQRGSWPSERRRGPPTRGDSGVGDDDDPAARRPRPRTSCARRRSR